MTTAEHERLEEARSGAADWRRWGTYVSERAWGTVREDYSEDGDAWSYFPFEHARSRAYRWNEDALAGWCDRDQTLCLGLALWNGRDPILKERPFGLSNAQGNHGEDVKDYWFYTDNLPTHAYAAMVYKYPQAPFPYDDLVEANRVRGPEQPEYELFDALREDWLADRYFDVEVVYAKPTPEEVICRITVTNRGADAATITALPQLWYRNTWTWQGPKAPAPRIRPVRPGVATTTHPHLGDRWLFVTSSVDERPALVFCENETNNAELFGSANASATTKDGIDQYVVRGDQDAVSLNEGSKVAGLVTASLAGGSSMTITVRLGTADLTLPFDDADDVIAHRAAEADDFYADLAAPDLSPDERLVQRQALAGLLWCKQYYHYAVRRWLKGDPGQPSPPASRWQGRNSDWQHFAMADVVLMPDAWEYPWFAAWDLAFHCVTLALVDPDLAKEQVLILLSSTTQHPHGQIPAYEWSFSDTNPPVHAWAAWQVYQLDRRQRGVGDVTFLATAYRAVIFDVVWWLNQKDSSDRGVFGGGFLGMDNVGVFDRDQPLPTGGTLDQVDGTAWMATLVVQMLEIAIELGHYFPSYLRLLGRWVWDAWLISAPLESGVGNVSFWDEGTGFYHDVIEWPSGETTTLEVFSMQGVVPLFAGISVPVDATEALATIGETMTRLRAAFDLGDDYAPMRLSGGDGSHVMVGVVGHYRLRRMLERVLDPEQFLSPHGLRSMSRYHREHPYVFHAAGQDFSVDYAPAESRTRMFGGNSNWRGPLWMPMNFLFVQSINSYARFFGDTFTVPDPSDSDRQVTLAEVADQMARRLTGLLVRDDDGRRPVLGANDYFQDDPHWRDLIPFHEYFDGDDGHGLGASHQTGWTAVVALLLQFRGNLRFDDLSD
ncbi:MAG: glucosidase [Actinomycetales bacterium]|nr:glucosidase [Actinomycetales bacterium]